MPRTMYYCYDCGGQPCKLDIPSGKPEVCPFPEDEGAQWCSWEPQRDRRRGQRRGSVKGSESDGN